MVGRNRLILLVTILSLMLGSVAGILVHVLNDQHQTWQTFTESTDLPHSPMNGLTNTGSQNEEFAFNIVGTNASIYVMSPQDYGRFVNGTLTFDQNLSQFGLSNTTTIVELPGLWSIAFFSGDFGATISGIGSEDVSVGYEGPFLVGSLVFMIGFASLFVFLKVYRKTNKEL